MLLYKDLVDAEKNNIIKLNWDIIYFGVKCHYLENQSIIDFATANVANNIDEANNLALLIESVDHLDNTLIEIATRFKIQTSIKKNILRKLRYLSLKKLSNQFEKGKISFTEFSKLLTTFYDDHNYPVDMIPFISYMPVDGRVIGGENNIIDNFKLFLNQECEWINGDNVISECEIENLDD